MDYKNDYTYTKSDEVEQHDKITKDDRLLVLQVCHYDPPGSYLIVICKEKSKF